MSTAQAFIHQIYDGFCENDPDVGRKAYETSTVRRLQEVFQKIISGDFASVAAHLSDDAVFEIVGPSWVPFLGRWSGRQTIVETLRNNFSQVEEQRPTLESVVAQGDMVILVFHENGR